MKSIAKFLGIFIAVSLLILANRPALADNLLNDPNFNDGVNGWNNDIGVPFTATSNPVYSPPYAAQNLVTVIPNQDFWGQIYQEFTYSAGQKAYGTMWVKTDISALAGAKAGVMLEFLDSGGQTIGDPIKSDIGGQTDWRNLYVAGTAPVGTVKVRLSGYLWANKDDAYALGGYAYVDDAVLSTDYIAPPPPQTTLLNPGFENGLNDWYDYLGYPSWVSQDPVHSGSYAAAKTIQVIPNQDYYSQICQDLVYSVGQTIYATMWAKTDISSLAGAKAGLKIEFLKSDSTVISELKSEIGGQTDWRLLYLTGVLPAETARVRLSGFVWANKDDSYAIDGIAYYDDAVISTEYIPPPPAQTVLINPGFENGLNDWQQFENVGQPSWVSQSPVHSGNYAAASSIYLLPDKNYWHQLYQEIPVTSGDLVKASLWAKSDIEPAANAHGGLLLQFLNSDGIVIGQHESYIYGRTDWTLLSLDESAPVGTVLARFNCYIWAYKNDPYANNGKIYYDDASFSKAPSYKKTIPIPPEYQQYIKE